MLYCYTYRDQFINKEGYIQSVQLVENVNKAMNAKLTVSNFYLINYCASKQFLFDKLLY